MNFILIILLIISFKLFLNAPLELNKEFFSYNLIIAVITLFIFMKKDKGTKGFIIHSNLFLIGYIIIYYQLNLDYFFDFINENELIRWADSYAATQSIAIANIGLISFVTGYITKKVKGDENKIPIVDFKNINILESMMLILLIGFVVFVDKTYLFGGYSADLEMGAIAEFCSNWIQILYISIITIKSYTFKNDQSADYTYLKYINKPLTLASIYILLILMSGARYEALRLMLVTLIAYIYSTKVVIPKSLIFIGAIAFSILFSLIGLMRGADNTTNLDQAYETMMDKDSILPVTKQLAFSYNTLLIAVKNVPEYFPYNWGLTFFPLLLFLIPGGRSLFLKIFDIPPMLQSSPMFITFLGLDGYDWGLGSSSLADVYISFGVIGIVIIFFIFGHILRNLEIHTFIRETTSPYILAFSFSFFSQIIFLNRESLLTSLVGMSYILLIIYLFKIKQEN